MKILFILFMFSGYLSAQELNLGGNIGVSRFDLRNYAMAGAQLEYVPKIDRVSFSINTELSAIIVENNVLISTPLYLKVMFGRKIRVSPFLGMFLRSNKNYGPTLGGILEIKIKPRLLISLKVDRNIDVYKKYTPNHFGGNSSQTYTAPSMWFSLGLRWNLLKKSATNN